SCWSWRLTTRRAGWWVRRSTWWSARRCWASSSTGTISHPRTFTNTTAITEGAPTRHTPPPTARARGGGGARSSAAGKWFSAAAEASGESHLRRRGDALRGGGGDCLRLGKSALAGLARCGKFSRSGSDALDLLHRGFLLQRPVRPESRAELRSIRHTIAPGP